MENEDLGRFSLSTLLARKELALQELLSVPKILQKIKGQMAEFVEYCVDHDEFAYQLIDTGIKFPMHESNNQSMKTVTYIACQILTSDHDAIADLLILPIPILTEIIEDKEICQEITDQSAEVTESNEVAPSQRDQFKYIARLMDYMNSSIIDQSCLNYMAKALLCVVRLKARQFFQFLADRPAFLEMTLALSHHSCISQLLGKLVSQDQSAKDCISQKELLIGQIIQKFKKQVALEETVGLLDFIEDIFQAGKYSDSQGPSDLQKISKAFVSKDITSFCLQKISNLTFGILENNSTKAIFSNCLAYLSMVVKRMNSDEEKDASSYYSSEKLSTLEFQCEDLFTKICDLAAQSRVFSIYQQSKLLRARYFDFLSLMMKNSLIQKAYSDSQKGKRSQALSSLFVFIGSETAHGIPLTLACGISDRMLKLEKQIGQKLQNRGDNWSLSLSEIILSIGDSAKVLSSRIIEASIRASNQNEYTSVLRKTLIVLRNYFCSISPEFGKKAFLQLFPNFEADELIETYSQKLATRNHPEGERSKIAQEFQFIHLGHKFTTEKLEQNNEPQEEERQIETNQMNNKNGKFKLLNNFLEKKQQKLQELSHNHTKLLATKQNPTDAEINQTKINQQQTEMKDIVKHKKELNLPAFNNKIKSHRQKVTLGIDKEQKSQSVIILQRMAEDRPAFFARHLYIY